MKQLLELIERDEDRREFVQRSLEEMNSDLSELCQEMPGINDLVGIGVLIDYSGLTRYELIGLEKARIIVAETANQDGKHARYRFGFNLRRIIRFIQLAWLIG